MTSTTLAPERHRGARGRGAIAALLAVLTGLASVLALLTGLCWAQLEDTDRFVASYAPMAQSPQVQGLVTTTVDSAILSRLGAVGQSRIVQGVVDQAVSAVVSSDAFTRLWEQTLRTTHTQLLTVLADEPGAVTYADGALTLQLGPIADAARQRLIDAGVPFASLLPSITASIPLVELDPTTVARARAFYSQLELAAFGLPWLAMLMGVASVLLWPNKRRALIVMGATLILAAAAVALIAAYGPSLAAAEIHQSGELEAVVLLASTITARDLFSPTLGLAVTGGVGLFLGLMTAKKPLP